MPRIFDPTRREPYASITRQPGDLSAMTTSHATKRVLMIGKDARTDAIAAACMSSPQQPELYALTEMPIPGLVEKCSGGVRVTKSLTEIADLVGVVQEIRPDLVIIGPEEPLAAGYVDELVRLGIPCFGPTKRLAQIESSKAWARQLLDSHHIPGNPDYRIFAAAEDVRRYMEDLGAFVIKPDGLTAGKGVRVWGDHFHSIEDAMEYAEEVLATHGQVQIEERLEGEEFSLQTITDGKDFIHCPLVQDHKRAYENDKGPNTGGMGSYSCADFSLPFLEPEDVAEAQSINEQVVRALARETGEAYRGVLYGGFMATRDGVRLIEYNCRFGDPEAMNVLPILDADFFELCSAVAQGELARVPWSFQQKATVCKYVVPRNYPKRSTGEARIVVPRAVRDAPSLKWYWAACRQDGDDVYLTSSRSGAFVGIGDSLAEAEAIAERAANDVAHNNPVRYRRDIGRDDAIEVRMSHMQSLRSGAAGLAAHHG